MRKLLLLDGNSMLFRAYYATVYGRMMRTANGIPTNAVFGFVTMFQKALEQIEPDGVLVAWDAGKPTFRHEAYQEYKGTRKALDQELIVQFPIAREFLDACGVKRYECEGIEADDIIGSFASAHPEVSITILSSDRDLLQLIDKTTDVLLMKKGISEMQLMDLQAKYNITYLFISHNLAVVKRICSRIAVMYLGKVMEYGSADKIFDNPLHPYTRALMSAVYDTDIDSKRERVRLKGEVPSPINPPAGCRFCGRCPEECEGCSKSEPVLVEMEPDHFVACSRLAGGAGDDRGQA